MKCKVCGTELHGPVCPKCGFDETFNYEDHPTAEPVQNTPNSVKNLKRHWRQWNADYKSLKTENDSLQKQLRDALAKNTANQQDLQEQQAILSKNQTDQGELQRQIQEAKIRIAGLTSANSLMQGRIDSLTKELEKKPDSTVEYRKDPEQEKEINRLKDELNNTIKEGNDNIQELNFWSIMGCGFGLCILFLLFSWNLTFSWIIIAAFDAFLFWAYTEEGGTAIAFLIEAGVLILISVLFLWIVPGTGLPIKVIKTVLTVAGVLTTAYITSKTE